MDKKFERYFGNNYGRKIYIASIVLIAIGLIVGWGYWWGYGVPIALVGVVGFFVSYGIQVTDGDIDEHVRKTVDKYGEEKIEGVMIGKEKLESKDFSYFYGFIRNDSSTRFVSSGDGKIRTSKYYVTAISSDRKKFIAFTSIYNLLSDDAPIDDMISTLGAEEIEFNSEAVEFPSGNKPYKSFKVVIRRRRRKQRKATQKSCRCTQVRAHRTICLCCCLCFSRWQRVYR